MTKEELRHDANKYANMNCVFQHIRSISRDESIIRRIRNLVVLTYIDSAEPREKQIAEKDKKIADLEAQIEYWKSEYDKLFNED